MPVPGQPLPRSSPSTSTAQHTTPAPAVVPCRPSATHFAPSIPALLPFSRPFRHLRCISGSGASPIQSLSLWRLSRDLVSRFNQQPTSLPLVLNGSVGTSVRPFNSPVSLTVPQTLPAYPLPPSTARCVCFEFRRERNQASFHPVVNNHDIPTEVYFCFSLH